MNMDSNAIYRRGENITQGRINGPIRFLRQSHQVGNTGKKGKGHAGQEAMVVQVAKVRISSSIRKYEKIIIPLEVNSTGQMVKGGGDTSRFNHNMNKHLVPP
jgi:hypothetical protein